MSACGCKQKSTGLPQGGAWHAPAIARASADAGACARRRSWFCCGSRAGNRERAILMRMPPARATQARCAAVHGRVESRIRSLLGHGLSFCFQTVSADPSPAPRPHRIARCQKVRRGITDSGASHRADRARRPCARHRYSAARCPELGRMPRAGIQKMYKLLLVFASAAALKRPQRALAVRGGEVDPIQIGKGIIAASGSMARSTRRPTWRNMAARILAIGRNTHARRRPRAARLRGRAEHGH